MNYLSLNSRGVGNDNKAAWIKKIKMDHRISFIGLQETKLSDHSTINFRKFWDSSPFDFDFVNGNGRTGGIICIWDTGIFNVVNKIKNQFFLVVSGRVNGMTSDLHIVNVYAPNDNHRRRLLWIELQDLKNSYMGQWIFLGDFNDIRFSHERNSNTFCPLNTGLFNDFIFSAGLLEYPMGGEKIYIYV